MSVVPVVSVVIPVHNPGPLLREQLRALADQSLDVPWEVVLADNGCTDGSLAVVDAVAHLLDVRVVDASERRGASYARNRGAVEARGAWLAYCDSDDVAGASWLARLWSARRFGDMVCGAWDVTALNDPADLKARGGPDYGRTLPDGPCDFLPYAPSCNVLIRRDLLERLGGWDETLDCCEDVDLSWRAQLHGTTLGFAADAVMHYRFRPSVPALVRQVRRYKAAEVDLFVRYRAHGARRQSVGQAVGRYWWLVSRSPYVVLDRERRTLWWAVLATVVGRAQGSLRHRVVYL